MFGEVIGPALAGGRQPFGAGGANVDVISGLEAGPRVTTDAGNLLGKSPASLGTGVQRRTPIVTDPRVRGSRVGQLAASGSYWVPARIDLDTMLSKIDSRIVDRMVVVNGPYSALYGPGFNWIDVELLPSPRYEGGFEAHGSTSVDYKVNGQQWYGRQSLWAGNDNWGARFGYGHRTGNDYFTGEATFMPASYKSRDMDLAVGFDLSPDSQIEFNGLRLDQTDVQYMGMAFDMDYLVTDGYEVRYVLKNQQRFDQLEFESWYNRTRFAGNAQSPAKRKQFPIFDFFDYVGFTNVDSFSSGFRLDASWGRDDDPRLTLGIDLRYLAQELDEIGSGHSGFVTFTNANSPLPRSNWVNPGVFAEQTTPVGERLKLTAGGRVDFGESRVIDDPAKLAHLGNEPPALQSSLADILGTSDFDQNFWLWSLYLTGDYELTPEWHLLAGTGYGQRPPSLTELYVAQSFMFVLQNGANTLTGDPLLRPEKLLQADLGLACKYDDFRGSVRGFYGWGFDYITFENLRVFHGPPVGAVVQESLKYVNTELATLAGFEMLGEYDVHPWWTPFANVKYVEGTDRTRNGDFATIRAEPGVPSTRDPTKPRGYYSGVAGAAVEPLPSILPLESRLGIRLHAPDEKRRWTVEFSARVVAAQDRVAVSLLETPTPGFTVYDLRGYWRPNDRWLLVGGVENLTNKNYREHLDFRSADFVMFQPGVNFYFGSELTY
jgi:outer membrane receptor protein involved in Fe transport